MATGFTPTLSVPISGAAAPVPRYAETVALPATAAVRLPVYAIRLIAHRRQRPVRRACNRWSPPRQQVGDILSCTVMMLLDEVVIRVELAVMVLLTASATPATRNMLERAARNCAAPPLPVALSCMFSSVVRHPQSSAYSARCQLAAGSADQSPLLACSVKVMVAAALSGPAVLRPLGPQLH